MARSKKGCIVITLDSFRKGYLRRRIAEAEAESDRLRRQTLTRIMDDMGVPADGKVYEYVLDNYKPVYTDDTFGDAFSEESVLDFLTFSLEDE
jgi:hypothetical protein